MTAASCEAVDRIAAILGDRWPTVSGPGWLLVNADCLDVMAAMPDKSVAHVITDPPYDEHVHSRITVHSMPQVYDEAMSSQRAAISRNADLGFVALTADGMAASAHAFARIARRWALAFCAVEMVADWKRCLNDGGTEYLRTCAWNRLNGAPQFTGDRPASAIEAIVVAHRRGRKRWNAGGKRGLYTHAIVMNRPGHHEPRIHTTQKPVALMVELVDDFTDPGDLVLDPYCGSATTGIACIQRGRFFVGIEKDADFFAVACRRMRGDLARPRREQPSLFDHLTPEAP